MERREDLLTVVAQSLILLAEEIEFTDTALRVRKALTRYTNRFDRPPFEEVDVDLSPADLANLIENDQQAGGSSG